ncbi:MAG: phytanoyl-CoA dioxygenase family protein [Micavibrio aeruginosavorus]|uniref:Phytanoyl-CoA dioxygenase family protein n=1 Tax=Micavibrio aeruginosavorus TaxID=349221 RepID=A0A7T5R308_9BACT|nr:MAG: phytanoyl-CoA dioxygenase family protein [Micavibrio aeruginosavorus]
MARIQQVGIYEDIRVIQRILETDGCIIIKGILSEQQVLRLSQELKPHFDETDSCHGDFYGYKTKRLSSLLVKSRQSWSMVAHNTVLNIMDHFLLRSCEQYQLHLTQAIRIGPGEFRQPLHRDDVMFPFDHEGTEAMVNCMWAVDDFTNENGATLVVPGSHKWPRDRSACNHEIIPAVMKAGSVLIWLGSLLHAGGTNNSAGSRTGVVVSYCLGWLRQAENSYLAIPQDTARALPEKLQRLIGYFVHAPNLGCIEGHDPILLLQGENIKNRGFKEFLPEAVKPLLQEHRKLMQAG